ncbi:hypothetical protein QJQ45_012901 [Haematococcus lacustris]|nr:hypothetical protein QJQ45_012901 [Haematococcus lacustris]
MSTSAAACISKSAVHKYQHFQDQLQHRKATRLEDGNLHTGSSLRHSKDVRGLKWCHEVRPNPPPPPPAQHPPAQGPPAPAQHPPPPPPAQDQPPAQAPAAPVPRPQAPPWGRWLDRDTNPCLNFQRIGESKQRPLELCSYEGLKA